MGGAPEVIAFMMLLVLQGIVGFYVLSYAGHAFLTVVQETAAGNDEVTWPDETLFDRFWRVFYLAWVAVCAAIPAVIVWPLLFGLLPKGNDALKVVLGGAPVLWLTFPLCLLSSLSAGAFWMLLNPGLFRRAVKRPGSLVLFYGQSAIVWFGCVALFSVSVLRGGAAGTLVLVAAPAAAAGLLIYARLLGRLGWVISRARVIEARKPRAKKRPRQVRVEDPWADSEKGRRQRRGPAVELPLDGPVEGYDLEEEVAPEERQSAKAPRPAPAPLPFDGPAIPYDVSQEPPLPLPEVESSPEEEELARRHVPPVPPTPWSLMTGIWSFPWYPSNTGVWLWLSFGFLVMGLVFLAQMQFTDFLRGP